MLYSTMLYSTMLYSTMMPPWWRRVLAWGLGRRFASDRGILALGTLAPGLGGHEPVVAAEQLARNLDLALEVGARAAVLYRLGGLTPAPGRPRPLRRHPGPDRALAPAGAT